MLRRVVAVMAVVWLIPGCGPASSMLQEHRRYTLPSTAMEPTIRPGQRFEARPVEHGGYRPKRGDVVVFIMPAWNGGRQGPLVERVVAIAGDRIGCCSAGKVVLNGAPLSEPHLSPRSRTAAFGPVTVPPGGLWLMGDNRLFSADSRMPGHGAVPATAVVAVAVLK